MHRVQLPFLLYFAFALTCCQSNSAQTKVPFDTSKCPLHFTGTGADGQVGFYSVVAHKLRAKLFPNNGRRKEQGIATIKGVYGVTHFFLDFDLTCGYVHPYSINFFRRLRPGHFVMKFDRDAGDTTTGYIYYIRRDEMKPGDTLGKNIALFREWRLSELDYRLNGDNIEINVSPCKFYKGCVCPAVKHDSVNAFGAQLPVWCEYDKTGYMPLNNFSQLNQHNGGTVVLIWQDKTGEILFQDVHGSLQEIITRAIAIAAEYSTDPMIGISDAGPMANKFISNSKLELDGTQFPLQGAWHAGAGFGYTPQ